MKRKLRFEIPMIPGVAGPCMRAMCALALTPPRTGTTPAETKRHLRFVAGMWKSAAVSIAKAARATPHH